MKAWYQGNVQPQNAKRILAIATGSLILGVAIWLSASSRTVAPTSGLPITATSATAGIEIHEMPPNVVTMLGVPEVILNSGSDPDSKSNDTRPAVVPVRAAAPAQAAPALLPKPVVSKSSAPDNNLAKILSGQLPPPAPARKR